MSKTRLATAEGRTSLGELVNRLLHPQIRQECGGTDFTVLDTRIEAIQ